MKKLSTILVALAAMLALAAPAMAQDPHYQKGPGFNAQRNGELAAQLESGQITLAEACADPAYFEGNCVDLQASASSSASASASPSASASASASPEATASAPAGSAAQYQYSAPQGPSSSAGPTELPDTGGSSLLLGLLGLTVVTGGALFGYLARRYS